MKYKIIQLLILCQLFFFVSIMAQNMAINSTGSSPNAAAILDLTNGTTSNFLGLLVPRVTGLPTKLAAVAQGLLFYNTNTSLFNVNTSLTTTPLWVPLSGSGTVTTNNLTASGNSSITSTVNSIASNVSLGGAMTAVWSVSGNAISLASTAGSSANHNFLGTLNNQDLLLETNSTERMRIANTTGNVGIGIASPVSTLDVNGTFGSNIVYLNGNSTNAAFTVGNTSANVYYTLSRQNLGTYQIIYLPTVVNCACYYRRFVIINNYSSTFNFMDPSSTSNFSTYVSLFNTPISTINGNTSIELIADPSTNTWLQIR